MRVNINYLKKFINVDIKKINLKELFASIGMEVAEMIDFKGKDVFEIEVTANRPDLLSHFGIARDIYAKLPKLKLSPLEVYDIPENVKHKGFSISIEDENDCGRYCGCIVKDIKVEESSDELKDLMESFGFQSINSIVDISNIVLMTTGQPIHIFDLDKLQGNEIKIRRGREGESIKLLNEQVVDLSSDFLVISDKNIPVALAGIMGGEDSGVSFDTKNILIESACFDPVLIRKADRKLGIQSDASYRFERGTDILGTNTAIEFILKLIENNQQYQLNIPYFYDLFPKTFTPEHIKMKKDYPTAYTGIKIEEELSARILENLGFQVEDNGENWVVEVPSFRVDIYGKQDLVEEIIRIYGYDRLDSLIPSVANTHIHLDKKRDCVENIRNYFASNGFTEVINYIFHSYDENALFLTDTNFVEIRNPIGKNFSVLRNSLIPGLLRNTALNFNHSINSVALFEFGVVFSQVNRKIEENDRIAISASGQYLRKNWLSKKEQNFNFYIFKSLIATWLKKIFMNYKFIQKTFIHLKEGLSFSVNINGSEAGYIGELKKEILDFNKIEKSVFVAEIQLSAVLNNLKENMFKTWNKFPSSKRDFSFLIDKSIKYSELESVIEDIKTDTLQYSELVDYYKGKNIPEEKVSCSMSFSYRDKNSTLTNEEVNDIHKEIINKLIKKLNLIQR